MFKWFASQALNAASYLVTPTEPLPVDSVGTTSAANQAALIAALKEVELEDENHNPVQWGAASPVYPGVPATPWNYAAATGGIDNSNTAVTIKTAAGASLRNYLTSISYAHATLGAGTEFAIRDGAGGTVLFRTILHTTAFPGREITFNPPLRSTANTLLEVITLTAVTGDVLVNAQGYVAA